MPSERTYRPAGAAWNIVLSLALVTGLFVACAACDRAPPGATPAGGGKSQSAAPRLRFEPPRLDHRDLAVGETATDVVMLRADADVDWRQVELATGCECLSARFLGTPEPRAAKVEIEVRGEKVESIEPDVSALGEKRVPLARLDLAVVVRRRPFVTPRVVVLDGQGSGRFEIRIGQAFGSDAKTPISILEDVRADDGKITLIDSPEERQVTEQQVLLTTRLVFEPNELARKDAFTTIVTLQFGVPAEERTVEVRWPGTGRAPAGDH